MVYLIGIHRAGTAQSLPFLESLGYIISNIPGVMAMGAAFPKTLPSLCTSPCVAATSTTAAEAGSEQAGPGDVQDELSPERAEQRDGPCANAGIPHGLSHSLGCGNKSTR